MPKMKTKKAAAKRRPSQCGSHVSAAQLTDIARILDGFGEVLDGLVALDHVGLEAGVGYGLGGHAACLLFVDPVSSDAAALRKVGGAQVFLLIRQAGLVRRQEGVGQSDQLRGMRIEQGRGNPPPRVDRGERVGIAGRAVTVRPVFWLEGRTWLGSRPASAMRTKVI